MVHVEMDPGNTSVFHCNILPRSDRDQPFHLYGSAIYYYNGARKESYCASHHLWYVALDKVSGSSIKKIGLKRFGEDGSDMCWMEDNANSRENWPRKY